MSELGELLVKRILSRVFMPGGRERTLHKALEQEIAPLVAVVEEAKLIPNYYEPGYIPATLHRLIARLGELEEAMK